MKPMSGLERETEPSDPSHKAARFNDLLSALTGQGDPLADALLDDYRQVSFEQQQLLDLGMRKGAAAIAQAPASFRAFLQDAEHALEQASPDILAKGPKPYLLIGPVWMSISLGPGSLVHTYADESIAAVLTRTGNLIGAMAARRLVETSLWNLRTIRPGGLVPGGPGYVQTLQVRLTHARVRAGLKRTGVSAAALTSIDQRQMLRTWLDFTVVALRALNQVGFEFTPQELASIYGLWQLIGRLLGIQSQALQVVTDHQSAGELLAAIDLQMAPPGAQSRALTGAMLDAIGVRLSAAFGLPQDIGVMLAHAFCRLFHGPVLAEQLGVHENWTASLLTAFTDANRYRVMRAREDSVFREMLENQALKAHDALERNVTGPMTYEQALSTNV